MVIGLKLKSQGPATGIMFRVYACSLVKVQVLITNIGVLIVLFMRLLIYPNFALQCDACCMRSKYNHISVCTETFQKKYLCSTLNSTLLQSICDGIRFKKYVFTNKFGGQNFGKTHLFELLRKRKSVLTLMRDVDRSIHLQKKTWVRRQKDKKVLLGYEQNHTSE